jgi:hypothetical protein
LSASPATLKRTRIACAAEFEHGIGRLDYRFRAATNDARTRISFFSYEEFGIKQVRTAWPREKYWR